MAIKDYSIHMLNFPKSVYTVNENSNSYLSPESWHETAVPYESMKCSHLRSTTIILFINIIVPLKAQGNVVKIKGCDLSRERVMACILRNSRTMHVQ